ncbi:hypothetical protein OOZ19_25315 [Saccharopolyspora sp. NFXS83]|uniref:hypothetical protein n=1 Tax=Saccharopolyspora sp. NFXS83 TaxID=2993560 RepID=UPI00224B5B2D|nr:hypothetical protein [Saccharopolyspora sp. NFXS83]MCX2733575.1 hypothetical protein [Saccharopolyspora sp. NFXS83]
MRARLIAGSMIAGLCLAGCGAAPESAPAQQPPAVVTLPKALEPPPPTADAAPSGPAEPSATGETPATASVTTGDRPSTTPTSDTGESTAPPDTGDTDCGEITNRAGVTYRLFAENDSGKTLGCAEAERVMTKYLSLPADEYQGSGRFANFEGYGCASTPQEREKALCAKQGISTYITA